jgi:putative FmdB family regulatory protein
MPVFDFQCLSCRSIFEALVKQGAETVSCSKCGAKNARKLLSTPSFSISKGEGHPTKGIEKRVKDYLKTGNFSEATRFADKAASMVNSDKVKKIQEKLHQKTG